MTTPLDRLAGYTERQYKPDIRLRILMILDRQPDKRLSDMLMVRELEIYGFNRDIEYVRNELQWMHENTGSIALSVHPDVVVAMLAEAGRRHLANKRELHGISPAPLPEV